MRASLISLFFTLFILSGTFHAGDNYFYSPSQFNSDSGIVAFSLPKYLLVNNNFDARFVGENFKILIKNGADDAQRVLLNYIVEPSAWNITIRFSANNFILSPGEVKKIYVEMYFAKGIIAGDYNISIDVYFLREGNIVGVMGDVIHVKVVGGESYKVTIFVKDSSGYVVYSKVTVYFLRDNKKYFFYRGYKLYHVLYAVESDYLIEVEVNGILIDTEVISVSEDSEIAITFSSIVINSVDIEDFSNELNAALRVKISIFYRGTEFVKRHIAVGCRLSYNNETIFNEIIANVTLYPMSINVISVSLLPNEKWKKGNYTLEVYLIEKGELLDTSRTSFQILTTLPQKERGINNTMYYGVVAILFSIIGFLLSRLTSLLFVKREKLKKPGILGAYIIGADGSPKLVIDYRNKVVELPSHNETIGIQAMWAMFEQAGVDYVKISTSESVRFQNALLLREKFKEEPLRGATLLLLVDEDDPKKARLVIREEANNIRHIFIKALKRAGTRLLTDHQLLAIEFQKILFG